MVCKSTAYFLLLCGGWLGLHHLYLKRWKQAAVWFMTFGGGFGMGCLRDIWRIPHYVAYANRDKVFMKKHLDMMAISKTLECSSFRHFGMIVMGVILSTMLCGLLPNLDSVDKQSFLFTIYQSLYIGLVILGSCIGKK